MGASTRSLGGGLSDAANQVVSLNSTTDILSPLVLSTTGSYVSGGFDSFGNSYTTRPIAITDVTVRVGVSGSANVGIRPFFKTSIYGTPLVNSTVTAYTGTFLPVFGVSDISLSTESSYIYKAFANSATVYYGVEGVALSGNIEYGAGGTGDGTYRITNNTSSTTLFPDDMISGSISWAVIPSSPGNPNALSITDTSANITWTAPSDDGMQNPAAYSASNINGYRINYRNSGSEKWQVLVANTGSNALYKVVTGLSPSTLYEIQVAALNDVTDAHNSTYTNITAHVGERSSKYSFTTAASTHDIRIWDGTTYKKGIVKVWDGSAWLEYPDISIKVWNGTAFEDVTLET